MPACATLVSVVLRTMLAVSLFGQEKGPAPQKSEIQTRAEALLERARHLSDIRAEAAPAFRLKANFSFVGDDLETVQGTYTETWVSDSQWRRETVIGNLRYVEIGGSDKHWLLYPDGFPTQANKLPSLMAVLPSGAPDLVFASVSEHRTPGMTAECAFTKPMVENRQFAFCFEKQSGALLEKVLPEKRPRNVVSFSCEYGTFRKVGGYFFPREVACFEDRHKAISANVVELSIEPPMDPALFDAPAGAIELGRCSGKTSAPALSISEIMYPGLDLDRVAWLRVWLVVDGKGRPQNLRVLRSTGKGSHEKALNTVRGWRFNPGTCDGKPMPMPLTMEIPSTPR
jgi:hypothetical protein